MSAAIGLTRAAPASGSARCQLAFPGATTACPYRRDGRRRPQRPPERTSHQSCTTCTAPRGLGTWHWKTNDPELCQSKVVPVKVERIARNQGVFNALEPRDDVLELP